MRLKDISMNNLKRRKGKVFFLILGLTIGITTVVTLISVTRMMSDDISKSCHLDQPHRPLAAKQSVHLH